MFSHIILYTPFRKKPNKVQYCVVLRAWPFENFISKNLWFKMFNKFYFIIKRTKYCEVKVYNTNILWINEKFVNFKEKFYSSKFLNNLTGRGATKSVFLKDWPHTSTDLTPLDFFFWGYIESLLYRQTC